MGPNVFVCFWVSGSDRGRNGRQREMGAAGSVALKGFLNKNYHELVTNLRIIISERR
jgi:hypothetical protein